MRLSILILTIPSRAAMLGRIKTQLWGQMLPYAPDIEVRIHDSATYPIGRKRNELLQQATGDYVCFIDDDDGISESYVDLLIDAANHDCDCASLKGMITFNGKDSAIFEHSIKYKEWRTVPNREISYERYPNHLNMIRASIAKQFVFPEVNHGEDADWSTQIFKSGLLKTEYYIDQVIYYYRYVTNKTNHV